MKKLFKALIIFLVVMVAIILIGYILRQSSWYKRTYPLKYGEYIVKYSKEYSLDPCLVAATGGQRVDLIRSHIA